MYIGPQAQVMFVKFVYKYCVVKSDYRKDFVKYDHTQPLCLKSDHRHFCVSSGHMTKGGKETILEGDFKGCHPYSSCGTEWTSLVIVWGTLNPHTCPFHLTSGLNATLVHNIVQVSIELHMQYNYNFLNTSLNRHINLDQLYLLW